MGWRKLNGTRIKWKKWTIAQRKRGVEFGIPPKDYVSKPRSTKYKGHTLYELALSREDLGTGLRFTRKIWKYAEPCYFTLTRIRAKNMDPLLKRGVAWGKLTWRGIEYPEEKITRGFKRDWRYVPETANIDEWWANWCERLRPGSRFLKDGTVAPPHSVGNPQEEASESKESDS
eukprot:TRINITY_DN7672_c0_g1_i1.p1 TRINITY_DN7672_c0_g1~~TRINITY_DN7672_c0_g1_i1.p1  ORF type:complete len:181 (+),score=42.67 TRINITY_DN7672_c0_g1_i1:23-544(+)